MAEEKDRGESLEDLANQYGDRPFPMATVVPEGTDPDATGYLDPPIGFHLFDVEGGTMHTNHEFRDGQETYYANQFRPKLVIPKGQPHAGCSMMDFLPLPLEGQTVSARLMNRWLNFMRGCGYIVPKGASAPTGFSLVEFGRKPSRQVVADIRYDVDQSGNRKLKDDGTPRVKVAFFGYHPVEKLKDLQARNTAQPAPEAAKKPAGTKEAAKPVASFQL